MGPGGPFWANWIGASYHEIYHALIAASGEIPRYVTIRHDTELALCRSGLLPLFPS